MHDFLKINDHLFKGRFKLFNGKTRNNFDEIVL